MKKIVGVKFEDDEKTYLFDTNKLALEKDDYVLVDSEQGILFGKIVVSPYEVNDNEIGKELNVVIRKADSKDIKMNEDNKKESAKALKEARKLSSKMNLEMQIIDAVYNYDRSQLLFHFLADNRVDFRELAKKLANNYHTRIELRQIGVRDKSKLVGGLGPCGRILCCNSFLTDFNSVSINMAKNQMLALNPTKINGICGRLLCCLNYEDDVYTEIKKDMPSIGEIYHDGDIEGKVVSINILKKTILIETKSKTLVEVNVNGSTK